MTASSALLVLSLAAAACPQADSATMIVPAGEVPFATSFAIVIEVRHGIAFLLDDPEVPAGWPVDATVVRIEPPSGHVAAEARVHLEARAFLIGETEIPPFRVRIRPAGGGAPVELATGGARVAVGSILPESSGGPEWIPPPQPGPGSRRWPLLMAAGIAAVACLLALVLAGRSRRRAPAVRRPGALELLQRYGADGASEPPPSPPDLSRLIRTALAVRLSLPGAQRTGQELALAAVRVLGARDASRIAETFDRLDAAVWGGAGLAGTESRALAASSAEILAPPPGGGDAAPGGGAAP